MRGHRIANTTVANTTVANTTVAGAPGARRITGIDQLAMARLPRATFALMLALLPAFATITGAVVLGQIPTTRELAGIGLVIAGVAVHRPDAGRLGSDAGPPKLKGRAGVPES